MATDIYDWIKGYEGYSDQPYWDQYGQTWTTGFGRTGNVQPGKKTTKDKEEAWLKNRVDSDREFVQEYGKSYGYNWTDKQIDALTSGVYNMGRGYLNQVTQGGTRDDTTIAQKIPLYNKAGGETLPGLVTRRADEAARFQGGPLSSPQRERKPLNFKRAAQQRRGNGSFGQAFAAARRDHVVLVGLLLMKVNNIIQELRRKKR